MKFSARTRDLTGALGFAASALNKRIAIPILAFLLLEADRGGVTMRGTDLDTEAGSHCPADVGEPGSVAINARLADLIETLPVDATVTLTCAGDHATIGSGRASYRIPALPVADFPAPLAAGSGACEFKITATDVLALFGRPAFAVSNEETRYYLNGIFLHLLGDKLATIATDGHRLARVTSSAPTFSGDWPNRGTRPGIIVPVKACARIVRLAADGEVSFRISDRIIEAHTNGNSVSSKLIDGTFPDYERVLPATRAGTAELDRKDLAAAITRFGAVIDAKDKIIPVVRLTWARRADMVELDLARLADAASDSIAAATSGTGTVPVSIRLLTELLGQFKSKQIRITAGDNGQPIVVTASDDPNFYTIVMPISV